MRFLIVALFCALSYAQTDPMNQYPYSIANGDQAKFIGEHFEVLGPETNTQYSEVYWAPQPLDLPQEIVQRFDDKVMAITGLEVDIVRVENGNMVSVPCWEQYNHHYSGWMYGKYATMVDGSADATQGSHGQALPTFDIADNAPSEFPHAQVFSEGYTPYKSNLKLREK